MKIPSHWKILSQIQQQGVNTTGNVKYFLHFTGIRRETDQEVNDASITLTYSRAHKMQTEQSYLRGEKRKAQEGNNFKCRYFGISSQQNSVSSWSLLWNRADYLHCCLVLLWSEVVYGWNKSCPSINHGKAMKASFGLMIPCHREGRWTSQLWSHLRGWEKEVPLRTSFR